MNVPSSHQCANCGNQLDENTGSNCPNCFSSTKKSVVSNLDTDVVGEANFETEFTEGTFEGPPVSLDAAETYAAMSNTDITEHRSLPRGKPKPMLFGEYELLEEIARGGMGVVYKARQRKANRIVALKTILDRRLIRKEEIERFQTEAKAAASLDHPNIVPVFDVGKIEEQHFFTMGYVEGDNLKAMVADGPALPRRATEIMHSVSSAVAYAHSKGVVHRDIKPSNILLNGPPDSKETSASTLRPMITDFGLAKQIEDDSELTRSGQVMGTPQFMPPEQAKGEIELVGESSDIYSLGATLYFLLTGRPPFLAASISDTLYQVINQEPVSPRQFNPTIDRDLETICLKCLQKDQAKRYQSADSVVADLNHWLKGEPIEARPVTKLERTWRWCRRNPVIAGLSAAAIFFLLFGTIVSSALAVVANDRTAVAIGERDRADANAEKLLAAKLRAEAATKRANDETRKAEIERNRADQEKAQAQMERDEAQRQRVLADSQRARAERQLYFNHIQSAHQNWRNGNAAAAWPHLKACTPSLRHWEFNYLQTLFTKSNEKLSFHKQNINAVVFRPDGRQAISGSHEGALKVWDPRTGRETIKLAGHSFAVFAVAYSPNGQIIASGSHDRTVKLWDANTGNELRTLTGHSGRVGAISFSPDGEKVVTASDDKTLRLWDVKTGEHLSTYEGHTYVVRGVAFHPNGEQFVSGAYDGLMKLWDIKTGKNTLTFKPEKLGGVNSVAFSPDGVSVVGGYSGGDIRIWNAKSGLETLLMKSADDVYAVCYSNSGMKLAASGASMTVDVWDAETGDAIASLQGHTNIVLALAFNPVNDRLASGGIDETIRVWDLSRKVVPTVLETTSGYITRLATTPDGNNIIGARYASGLQLCDTRTGQKTVAFKGHVSRLHSASFSNDGKSLATGDDSGLIKVWNAATGEELHSLKEHQLRVTSLAFSPDSSKLISGSSDGLINLWNVKTGKVHWSNSDHTHSVDALAFSPNGEHIVSGGQGVNKSVFGEAHVWKASDGTRVCELVGHGNLVGGVAYSPDGLRILTASHDNTIKMWDAKTGVELFTCSAHTSWANSVAFSPDGERFVSASRDKTVKVWNAKTGEEAISLVGHTDNVSSALFSRDGRSIFSAGMDNRILRWDSTRASLFTSSDE